MRRAWGFAGGLGVICATAFTGCDGIVAVQCDGALCDASSDGPGDSADDAPLDATNDARDSSMDGAMDGPNGLDATPDAKKDGSSDASDGGPVCPTPADVSMFVPPAFVPPNPAQSVCTSNQIQGKWDNCFDPQLSTPQKCMSWDNSNMTCAACIETSRNANTWGALVDGNGLVSLDIAGCVDLLGDVPCAKAIEQSDACSWAACDAQCPITDLQSLMDWQKCVQVAQANGCKKYVDAVNMTCVTDSGTAIAQCRNFQSFKDGFFLYAPLFCTGGG